MLSLFPRPSAPIQKKNLILFLAVVGSVLLLWNWKSTSSAPRVSPRYEDLPVRPVSSIFSLVQTHACTFPRFIFTAQERFAAGGSLEHQFGGEDDPTARARVGPNPQLQVGANYTVIYNFASPQPSADSFRVVNYDTNDTYTDEPAEIEELIDEDHITYVTHATPEFLHPYLTDLLDHWPNSPLSVAVYAPGNDFCLVTALISWLWTCEKRVRQQVSFHIYFPSDFANDIAVKTASEGIQILDANCDQDPIFIGESFRKQQQLPYPVNTGRNIARSTVRTKYLLTSDIELYPSPNLSQNFVKFISGSSRVAKLLDKSQESPVVFVLPIFEIEEDSKFPKSKKQLINLYKEEKAVYFHKNFCKHCQKFPGLDEWVLKVRKPKKPTDGPISIFQVSERQPPFDRWEPIYIGTQDDPLYDERLSWEGFQDKMSQMVELCLHNYKFVILDNAFLVHKPGIKVKTSDDGTKQEPWRLKFVARNSQVYETLMRDLSKKYGDLSTCTSEA
eukprot:maker-scaffold14_size734282-snap-gene-3.18 protein:Tk11300 transcript:maker-scaffold14_size734282-snap-gene-3.18-mRNA-1 annotation:"n-acetyllactosaminide beta- -n-acetylglucosaminyltransferase-like"